MTLGYVLKVLSTLFEAQVITLSALPVMVDDQGAHIIFLVQVLRVYVERTSQFQ